MCLAVPAKLITCTKSDAVADLHGNRVRVNTVMVPDALPGDWVLVHAGFAIQRLEPQAVSDIWAAVTELHRPAVSVRQGGAHE
jgi:hydrogenase expression/formation protein HypC